ncbi:MAG: hypothetical protein KC731_03865 [Myxococcales bacterium]|nr:hypothetical protein [Myxococcales bacterium]
MQSWQSQGLGIVAVTLLLDAQNEGPPTVEGALNWKNAYGLNSVYVAADPQFSMVPGNSVGTPQLTIIDPRTMQVVLLQEGWGGSHPPQLVQLAQQNQ